MVVGGGERGAAAGATAGLLFGGVVRRPPHNLPAISPHFYRHIIASSSSRHIIATLFFPPMLFLTRGRNRWRELTRGIVVWLFPPKRSSGIYCIVIKSAVHAVD
jgi:hypothetical protein